MRKSIESDLYEQILDKVPIPTIDVLIFDKSLEKTLLFLRKNAPAKGDYYSIGGRLEKGEELLEGAINNFYEEIGIKLTEKELHPIGTINEIFEETSFGKNGGIHSVNYFFALKVNGDLKIKLDNQHYEHRWFDVNYPGFHPYMEEKIKRSLEVLKKI
ncbi:MAG: NUDIX domain-containing protein [archaeon]|nr:NUDIX domain-containing protein [archaeon]